MRNPGALEAIISKGAAALMRIRDGQLYRETYKSYDEYLATVNLTRRQADKILGTYKIQPGLS